MLRRSGTQPERYLFRRAGTARPGLLAAAGAALVLLQGCAATKATSWVALEPVQGYPAAHRVAAAAAGVGTALLPGEILANTEPSAELVAWLAARRNGVLGAPSPQKAGRWVALETDIEIVRIRDRVSGRNERGYRYEYERSVRRD